MSKPSFEERTAIRFGEEHQVDGSSTTRLMRTGNFVQIPVYGTRNPLPTDITMMPLPRAKPTLDPDGFGTGEAFNSLTGQIYVYGSGIANIPPDWFKILKATGMSESRIATNDLPESGSPSATASGSDGELSAGTYYYKFTTLVESDGVTPAETLNDAAYESKPSASFSVVVAVGQHVSVSGLPASGVKRIYRTYAGGSNYYYFAGTVEHGETTFTDRLADKNLGEEIVVSADPQAGTLTVTEGTSGTLAAGDYSYCYTSLYDARGNTVTDSKEAVFESSPSDPETGTTTGNGFDVTGLPSGGVKRLYRTVEGPGTTYYFVCEVPHGSTSVSGEDTSDTTLVTHEPLHATIDKAVYVPVSDYDKFWSLTVEAYLDGRKKAARGMRGNMTFEGRAGQNIAGNFELRGAYVPGAKAPNPTSVSAPSAPSQLCNADMTISRMRDGEPVDEFVPRLRVWGLNLGRTPAPRPDGNASCENAGVIEYMIAKEPDPHMTVTIEFDEDQDFDAYAKYPDTFSLGIVLGNRQFRRVRVSNDLAWGEKQYVAQLAAAPTSPDAEADGIRLLALDFKLCGVHNSYIRIEHY